MIRTIAWIFCACALVLVSCARDEQRAKPYDERQCPFCTQYPGRCAHCPNSGKCALCNGTGKRTVSWKASPENGIQAGSLEEQCVFCKGSGNCPKCDGSGKCRMCKGTGTVSSWNFYENSTKEQK